MNAPPIRFCFGLHLHQPVGNFGHVFEQHVRDVYLPFLERLRERSFFPISLHVSGPLIEWLQANDPRYLDLLGELASDGRVELLLAGFYEPILAALPRADRVEQILWMRDALRARFGVEANGLWLTERVWEPDLAADLHDAGVRFAIVDDRHFLVSGFTKDQLYAPFRTEHDGKSLALFPIDERLRYLVPFHSPEEIGGYLAGLRTQGHRLAVLADDGEKFGGWPGTLDRVYAHGWLDRFLDTLHGHIARGEVQLSRFDEALREVPSAGLAYLPTASYREMEEWSLPAKAAVRLAVLEKELGYERLHGADGALVRGAHWRNFLVKYCESNRMHKKMLALSKLCRERGDPPDARRAIGRAQCNDAYWHGVFGGLYLPFLRGAIWQQLARAERELRAGESIACDVVDMDGDGFDELWVHSAAFSAVISPHRGGAIEELSIFGLEENLADALTRRREAYHMLARRGAAPEGEPVPAAETRRRHKRGADPDSGKSAPSIHDLEHELELDVLPPIDLDDRRLFIERVLSGSVSQEAYAWAEYVPVMSTSTLAMSHEVTVHEQQVEIRLTSPDGRVRKRYVFDADGSVTATFEWAVDGFASSDVFTSEMSFAREVQPVCDPAASVWSHAIETVAKSERGLERTRQGVAYLARWPIAQGRGEIALSYGRDR